LLFVNFLVKPAWIFGIDLQVQNQVGAAEYGLYAAIFSHTLMFNILLDMGLSHYSNRNMAQHPERLAQSFSRLSTFKLLLGLVYLAVALLIGFFLGFVQQAFTLLLLLAFNQFLLSLIVFFRSHLAGLHLYKTDAFMSVFDKGLTIILCGAVLYGSVAGWGMNITLFALLQTLSLFIAAAVAFSILWNKAQLFKFSFRFKKIKKQIRESVPYALLILLMAMYTRVDSVMLQQISGEFENGIYAQAFRLLDAVNQPGYLFSVLLLPMFSGMLVRKESVQDLSRLAFTLIMVLSLAIALAGCFAAPGLMAALYVHSPELSTPVFQWLIFSAIAFGATYIFGTLLTARGSLGALNRVALIGFGLNIILNAFLIPSYGAWGAAVATVSTQSLTAVVQIILTFKVIGFKYANGYWTRLLVFAALAAISAWFLAAQLALTWYILFLVIMVSTALWALVLKLLPLKAAILLMKQRLASR
jgi:O-antigen/teichoic acid export membrane protein